MKVGLITLYNNNLGSALQCYATQRFLQYCGVECDLLNIPLPIFKMEQRAFLLKEIATRIIRQPKEIKRFYIKIKKSGTKSSGLTGQSSTEIKRFIHDNININYLQRIDFRSIAEEYDYFFTGSDQVWNGERIEYLYYYFLRFANENQRIAWAPSFGTKEITGYNKKIYQKYISEFKALSVRETSGKRILEQLVDDEVTVLSDPVCLLNRAEWENLAEHSSIKVPQSPYILMFFINPPSEDALKNIKEFIKNSREKLFACTFAYKYDGLLENCTHVDGGPADFIKLIANAKIVCTDSFHATLFSVIFHVNFFVFDRNYNSTNQSTRITDLLEFVGLEKRFNSTISFDIPGFEIADDYLLKCRSKYLYYLRSIDQRFYMNDSITVIGKTRFGIGNASFCSACGACVNICVKSAISFSIIDGAKLPVIDPNKCVNCGKCRTACQYLTSCSHLRDISRQYFGYVGYGKELLCGQSTSGGLFSAIAIKVLASDGVVYGAALIKEEGKRVRCQHLRVDSADDLPRIIGSKYVRSDIGNMYKKCKNDLDNGRNVIFSGTSCEIEALYRFLRRDYDNLITVDLVCHGVPKDTVFSDYIDYIEKKYSCEVKDIRFRRHDTNWQSDFLRNYCLELDCISFKTKKKKTLVIPYDRSAYYRMFMDCAGYRESCYHCQFAMIDKPADITLGDFFPNEEQKKNYSDLLYESNKHRLSMAIVRSKKGLELLKKSNCTISNLSVDEIEIGHRQLKAPSYPDYISEVEYSIYCRQGFGKLQRMINAHNRLMVIPKALKKIICK